MSCSLWRWTPSCDDEMCVGDCDLCSYEGEEDADDNSDLADI